MKKYNSNIEDRGYFWRVELLNETKEPFTWVNVDKSEFPTEKEALDYLIRRYESESRKKRSKKSKVKRKVCGCKK